MCRIPRLNSSLDGIINPVPGIKIRKSALFVMIPNVSAEIQDGRVNVRKMKMQNPNALTDEVLDDIEDLLRAYDIALENILYKNVNPWPIQQRIQQALKAIDYARQGPSDEELMRDFESFGGGTD